LKVGVAIITRNHPGPLTAVVMGLWRLRSTLHEIHFIFGLDADDKETVKTRALMKEITPAPRITRGPRAPCRGTTENRALWVACELDCDVVTLLTDRTVVITPGWDDMLARGAVEQPKRPLWWSCPTDNVCAIPIMPRALMDAMDWRWSPELFPFWFDDTWNQQIDLLIHGLPSLKVKANFSGQRGKTTRGRDFGFWIEFFHRTLPIRVAQAQEIAAKLGFEFRAREDVLKYFNSWYEQMKAGAASLQETFGDPRDPGPEYAVAKANAERMMAEMTAVDMGVAAE
jgi:hypothetical protein